MKRKKNRAKNSLSLSLGGRGEEGAESFPLPLPLRTGSIEAALQVRPVDPLQRHYERRRPQWQLLFLGDAPQVREGGSHRLVQLRFNFLLHPLEVLDVLYPLEEAHGDAAAAGELSVGVVRFSPRRKKVRESFDKKKKLSFFLLLLLRCTLRPGA